MKKISENLKTELYNNISEDDLNLDVLLLVINKENDNYYELVQLNTNGEEFDLPPLKHVRIISISETRTDATISFICDPVILRGKNDRHLFKSMNIENFIKKNKQY